MLPNEQSRRPWVIIFARQAPHHCTTDNFGLLPVLSVAAAFVTGVVYLVPLNFVLTNISDLLAVPSLQPMPLLFKLVVGSAGGAFGLLFLSESIAASVHSANSSRQYIL